VPPNDGPHGQTTDNDQGPAAEHSAIRPLTGYDGPGFPSGFLSMKLILVVRSLSMGGIAIQIDLRELKRL
jgi:hypothetical protein